MKQIIKNRYLKVFSFSSFQEAKVFLSNQDTKKKLSIDEAFGDNYFCYVCYQSLTSEKQFVLSFSSDEDEGNLNFLFWDEHEMLVLDTGKHVHLIDNHLNIVAYFEITTPLIGLYLVNKDKLLLLEEAFFRLVDFKGTLLKSELFDAIVNFQIKHGQLSIQTDEKNKSFDLA